MRRVFLFLGLVLAGWLASWISVGVFEGQLTAALSGETSEAGRIAYLVLLYLALSASTWWCWRRMGPRLWGWDRPILLGLGLMTGLGSGLVHRLVLWLGGWWEPPSQFPPFALAAGTSLALAVVEEAVFRGYLLGVVYEDRGRLPAFLGVGLFFTVVHLLRPGGLMFKAAYGLGLFISALVLARVVEHTRSLWPAVGVHASWIAISVVDPPGRVSGGWLAGLDGDPAAGVVGWLLLAGLYTLVPRLFPSS